MEFIEKFKNYLFSQGNGASRATVKNYLADVKQFIAWVESFYHASFDPKTISIQTIQTFKNNAQEKLSASSLDRHISSLKKFFTFLKLNGDIAHSPFDAPVNQSEVKADPWHVHEFKNFLYVYNASHLTIKNYIIDVKQFLSWAEHVLQVENAWIASEKNVLTRIDNKLVEEYKSRLIQERIFSPASINRKLSSLRKYLSWAAQTGYMSQEAFDVNNVRGGASETLAGAQIRKLNVAGSSTASFASDRIPQDIKNDINAARIAQSQNAYSKIPPIRLFQKLTRAGTWIFDLLITRPVAYAFRTVEHGAWVVRGKKVFTTDPAIRIPQKNLLNNWKLRINNISKEFYSPLSVSTKHFTWSQKLFFHLKYTRPNWYRKYHRLAIAHYFNWAILIIFATAIGFGLYNGFFQKAPPSLANLSIPSAPERVLSFQGMLTDANNNPITSPTWVRFIIYNQQTASGSARLWEEVDKVTPDQNGIFSTLLGSDNASDGGTAALCNGNLAPSSPATGACGIPSTVFTQNNALWLGVTVESTPELAPREQLATVAYASNAETLQGLPPITATGSGTQNVVLVLNSSGNLAIGGSTEFQSTSGSFILSGNTVAIQSNPGTNGNIVLAPDGNGTIDLQAPLQTSTNNGQIASVPNALTIADIAAILATSSGQSALTINQNGTGPIISASHSGTAEFTVDSLGNGTFNGNVTGQVFYTGGGTSYYINNTTSNLNSLSLANNLTVAGNVGSNLNPSPTDTYSLGTSSNEWLNIYGKNIYSNGVLLTQYWQENLGALSPIHTRDDLIIGGTATSDATFQVFGSTSGVDKAGTASTSGNLTFGSTAGTNPNINILNGNSLVFKTSPGGDNGTGYLTAATISTPDNGTTPVLNLGTGANSTNYVSLSGGRTMIGFDGPNGFGVFNTGSGKGFKLFVNGTSGTFTSGTDAMDVTTNGFSGFGTNGVSKIGNGQLVVNQTNISGLGDIFTASAAGVTKFTVHNSGQLQDVDYTTAGGILYADGTGTFQQTTAGLSGQCLQSTAGSAPTWGTCGSGGGSYWQLNGEVLSPIDSNNDLAIGGNSTASAAFQVFAKTVGVDTAGTASTSANFTFADAGGTNPIINILNGNSLIFKTSPGGDNGTGYTNALTLGPNSIQFYTASNVITPAGNLTLAGTITLSNTTVLTGSVNTLSLNKGLLTNSGGSASTQTTIDASGNVLPGADLGANLGSPSLRWNNVYAGTVTASNFFSPITGGISGFWQLANGLLAPTNVQNSLAIGGVATNAATFQVFGQSFANGRTVPSGTATTSGDLVFAGSNEIDYLNGNNFVIKRSPGGDTGLVNVLTLDNAGNTTLANALSIGGNVSVTGQLTTSLVPTSTSINLGSPTNYYGSVYANNFIAPNTGGISGYWQLSSGANYGVLSPTNIQNDLAIGGVSTSSAVFQVFAQSFKTNAAINSGIIPAGTATTSGNLTFKGTAGSQTPFQINLLNGSSLGFYNSAGGDNGLVGNYPSLFISSSSAMPLIGVGTNNPQGVLDIASQGQLFPSDLTLGQAGGKNLVLNPSFEYSGSQANGWTLASAKWTASTTNALFGAYALKFTVGSSTTENTTSACITASANTTYTLSGYAYVLAGLAGSMNLHLAEFTGSNCTGTQTNDTNYTTNVTNKWTRIIGTQTTAGTTASVEVVAGTTGATGTFYLDGIQLEQGASATPYIDGSLGPGYAWTGAPNNSASIRNSGAAFAYNEINSASGLGAASSGISPTLQLDQDGAGNIIEASASGVEEMRLTTTGNLYAHTFTDLDNTTYFLDPAASGTAPSASVAGSLYFDGTNTQHNINLLSGGQLAINTTVGGTSKLNTSLYVAAGNNTTAGNVGIGTTTTTNVLTVYGADTKGIDINSTGRAVLRLFPSNSTGSGTSRSIIEFFDNTGSQLWSEETDQSNAGTNSDWYLYNHVAGNYTIYANASTNNVGIGTTAPLTALQVNGSASIAADLTFYRSSSSNINFNLLNGLDHINILPSVGGDEGTSANAQSYVSFSSNRAMVGYDSASNAVFQSGGHPLELQVNSGTFGQGTVAVHIATNGNVGIGTTNPTSPLFLSASSRGFVYDGAGDTEMDINDTNTSGGNARIGIVGATNGHIAGSTLAHALVLTNETGVLQLGTGTSGSSTVRMTIDTAGNVGIGTTSLSNGLTINASSVQNTGSTGHTLLIEDPAHSGYYMTLDSNGGGGNFGGIIQGRGGTNTLLFNPSGGSVTIDSTTNFSKVFNVGTTCTVTGTNSCVDYAEFYNASEIVSAGDILSLDPASASGKLVQRSSAPYDNRLIGIVSTNPAVAIEEGVIDFGGASADNPNAQQSTQPTNKPPVALAGRVPVKVSTINGTIRIGDAITSSQLVGVGMKATQAGEVVGRAMQDFDPANGETGQGIIDCPAGTPSGVVCGEVFVFTNTSWYDPQVYLTDTGDIHMADTQPSVDFTIPHYYTLSDSLGNPITRMGAFVELVAGNLRVGSVNAQQVVTNSLAVATGNVSIAGVSLHDYVVSVVNSVLQNAPNNSPTSPIAEVNEVHTNVISPLGDNPQIAIRVNNSGIEIAKDASSSAVASIDNNGNATFSGTLQSQNLAVNGDATISGTLYANNIEANSISGLSEIVSTLSAQNITNVTNMYFATPSANQNGENIPTGSETPDSTPSALLASGYANIASYSAFLAYIPDLQATTGEFANGLVSLGPTSLTDTSINGELSIGSQMILADNSINVLGGDLEIQPLRQGGIAFAGHQIYIDSSGNLTVSGNATFNGNLAANTISPVAGHNLQLNLANGSATGAAQPNLTVNNASGSAIFAVNQLGDLVASGAANIGKLNFNLVAPALAVSNTEVIATGSAGTTSIAPHQNAVTIDNPNVTDNSLIYITPVGTDQTPYLERQTSGKSFTVGIPAASANATNFNWLIVN